MFEIIYLIFTLCAASYIWNIALCGCETWTIATEEKKKNAALVNVVVNTEDDVDR